jgi:hypothetical protein
MTAYDVAVDATVAPVYHWKLGEASGATRCLDRKAAYPTNLLKNAATLGATGIVVGNSADTAASFTPTSNIYDDGTPPTRSETAWTWVAWITPQSTGAAQAIVVWDSVYPQQFCGLELDSALKPNVWRHDAPEAYPTVSSSSALTAGATYRITGRWDGTTQTIRVNATTVGTLSTSALMYASTTPSVVIGSASGSTKPFSGVIDEVAWYNVAISDANWVQVATGVNL